MENVVNLACRMALSRRGVSHVTVPVDFQDQPCEKRTKRNVPHHNTHVRAHSSVIPHKDELKAAANLLNKGKKIVILAGQGALHATDELENTAEILGAPIVKPLLGKAVVPDDSPYTTGGIGLLGTRPSVDAMETCDTLLVVGTSFPYIEFYPKPGQARIVQIELDSMRIGLRCDVEVGLIGDSKETLHHLLPLLKRNKNRDFLKTAQKNMKEWNALMKVRQTCMDMPMKPQVVAAELGKRLKSDAIISSDSGTITTWMARDIPAKRGQMFSLSGNLASMAPGLPYTLAAQIAYPHRQCIAFVGDGGFSMLMADFVTAVKYKLPIKVVVIKNNTLGQIKWEQIVFLGNPEYEVELQPINFALFAEACGGTGFRIENPHECGDIIEKALNTPGPVIIEAIVDPYEPPMPPKIEFDEAKNLTKALIRGEPNRGKIIKTLIKDKIRELI